MAEDDGGKATIEGFRPWAYFRFGQAKSVYMNGQDNGADQEEILKFVDHQACNSYYEYPDICDMLGAIRDRHLRAGYPGPLKDKLLVKGAMIDLSEGRRKPPAWQRASMVAEMRQIERGPGNCGTSFHPRRTGFPVGVSC